MGYRRFLHIALLALVVGANARATLADGKTYYVRQGGSDLSDGLAPATALRSIQRAVARCTGAGNSIIVGPGVYYEQVFIGSGAGSGAGNGTADNPNLIVADTTGSETGDNPAAVVIEGDGVRERGLVLSHRDDWAIVGVSFRGQSQRAVCVEHCDGVQIESCTIEVPRTAGIDATDGDRLLIDGNTFVRSDDSGSSILVQATSRESDHGDAHDEHDGDAHDEHDGDAHDEHDGDAHDEHDGDARDEHDGRRDDGDDHEDDDDAREDDRGQYHISRVAPGLNVVIQCNRFSMTGEAYLGSGYGREGHGGHDRHSNELYGIRLELSGSRAAAQIINNIGSDCWAGISLQLYGDNASAVIANNSLAGCRVGIEADANHGSVLIADNIIAQSRFAIAAEEHDSGLTISGLLTFEIVGSVVLGDSGHELITGHVQNVDPQWVAPSAGNFALESGSPAVDAGQGAAGVGSDLRGLHRPWDGDGDGEAIADLGACEYHSDEDQNRTLRLVRWREIEPQ